MSIYKYMIPNLPESEMNEVQKYYLNRKRRRIDWQSFWAFIAQGWILIVFVLTFFHNYTAMSYWNPLQIYIVILLTLPLSIRAIRCGIYNISSVFGLSIGIVNLILTTLLTLFPDKVYDFLFQMMA